MKAKKVYIIPFSVTASLPPGYMPNEFAQPCLSIDNYKVEFLDISVQQHCDGPYGIMATGKVVVASTSPQDAIYSVVDCGWVKLSNHGVSAILDDVNVEIGDGDILAVNTQAETMSRVFTSDIDLA
ncbi:hypothetical protein RYZ26_19590 [Terasakiella sp. A23]|uniref:hypothetical protein n=1 Tax=Terasakiella sp. FCG-A23 TaxID=3080561 RepID=UPI002955A57C|nr:hypothetical protein [Terasakiella sp. A23]MDV7341808.1 hypothetical protein [Terasakiella sp. A23]